MSLTLQDEYKLYLLSFLTQDFEAMIDSKVMSYNEWLEDRDKDKKEFKISDTVFLRPNDNHFRLPKIVFEGDLDKNKLKD
jgi:hypothetical protein